MHIFFIISLIVILIVCILIIPLKIYFNANSQALSQSKILISLFSSFFVWTITFNDLGIITLNTYIFKKLIKTKPIVFKKKSSNNLTILKNLKLDCIDIQSSYGFKDPIITGIICGIINLIPCLSYKSHIKNYPDFNCDFFYFNTYGKIQLKLYTLVVQRLKTTF